MSESTRDESPTDFKPVKLLYTPTEAATILSIGRTRVFQLIAAGELDSVKVGASRRIPASALVDFVVRLDAASDSEGARCPPSVSVAADS